MTTFQLFKRNNGKHYYRIIADTGHNIMSSDGYPVKSDCVAVIEEVKNRIMDESSITIEQISTSELMFTVSGADKSIIGYSMPYHSEAQCRKWIKLMQENLPVSNMHDLASA